MYIQYIHMYMCVLHSLVLQSARARGIRPLQPQLLGEVQTQLLHWCTAAQDDGEACNVIEEGVKHGTINRGVVYNIYIRSVLCMYVCTCVCMYTQLEAIR